jgi:hypothetical protein
MTSGTDAFSNQSPAHLVLAIHGVGNPKVGEIAETIAKNLSERTVTNPVYEINWNEIVEKPLSERGNIHVTAIATLARVIANISLTCPRSLRGNQRFSLLGIIFRIQQIIFVLADALIATAFWITLVFPPSAYLGGLASTAFVPDPSPVINRFEQIGFSLALPVVRIALYVVFLFLTTCPLQALLTRSLSPVFIGTRRSLGLILRPLLFVMTFPLLLPWRSIVSRAWRSRAVLGRILLIALVLYASALALMSQYRHTLTMAFDTIVKRAAEICFVSASAVILIYALNPALKILMDIFRYAGDPPYRQRIQTLVTAKVGAVRTANGSGEELYILAHSLGSVIAIDSLLNTEAFIPADRITLITIGSPLRRFFFRFFPNLFFPDTAALCAKKLASRFAGFRWINCYRPFDQIGTRLGLPDCEWTSEVSTSQYNRIASAHPDYWGDPIVSKCILDECRIVSFTTANSFEPDSPSPEIEVAERRTVLKILWAVLIGAMTLAPIVGFVIGAKQYSHDAKGQDAILSKIQSEGIETYADVTYERRPTMWDETGPGAYETVLTFSYDDLKGLHHKVVVEEDELVTFVFDPSEHVLDVNAVKQFVRGEQTSKGVKAAKVRIKYLADNPELIYVTQFPPIPNPVWVSITMLASVVLLIFVTYYAAKITYFVGGVISELFVGQPVFSTSFFE